MQRHRNSNSAMESENRFKNGVRLRNLTRKGGFILFVSLTISAGFFIFNSCKEKESERLEVSPTNLNFEAEETDYKTVFISGNSSWSASSSASWCEVSNSYGKGNGSIRIAVIKNTSTSSRNTMVVRVCC